MSKSRPKRHKSFPEDHDKKKLHNQSERIKELEREIKRLKAELKTLNDAFKKSAQFMSDESKLLTVKELIKAAEDNKTLKAAKDEFIPDSIEEAKRKKEEVRRKWDTWNRSRTKKDE